MKNDCMRRTPDSGGRGAAARIPGIPEWPWSWRLTNALCERIHGAAPSLRVMGRNVKILHVYAAHMPARWRCPREYAHDCYEAHVFLSGNVEYEAGKTDRVGPGAVLVHNPREHHTWRTRTSDFRCLVLWFAMSPRMTIARPESWPVLPEMLWDVLLLFREAGGGAFDWRGRVKARLQAIISRILAIGRESGFYIEPALEPDMAPVKRVDGFLAANIARPIRLRDAAQYAGMSQSKLKRYFRAHTGETVMQRLAYHRLDTARMMLGEGDAPISGIAEAVGMPDVSYFCRRFKRAFNETPLGYRRKALMNAAPGAACG